MLYLAIPAHNEVATIGVLLWRLRTVLAEFPREYEVVVYDDASTDETAEVAEQYVHAMPVTVLRGTTSVGYAGAVDALSRYIANQTRYPRRDAMLLMQSDFTDPPGIVPEFARRFEGGADLVVGERTAVVDAPVAVRRLFTAARWALRPFVKVDDVHDLTGSMRLVRISALRDLIRTVGDAPVCEGDSWTANADLLLRLVPHARRVESVPVEPTYGVRTRETRRVTVRDALAALRWGWRARGRRSVPTSAPDTNVDAGGRAARNASPPPRRREEPDVTAERLRERAKDRSRTEPEEPRSRRERRPDRPEREKRDVRAPRTEDAAADARRPDRERKPPRERTRDSARPESQTESPKPASSARIPGPGPETRARKNTPIPALPDHIGILDDPFAGRRSVPTDPFTREPNAASTSAIGSRAGDTDDTTPAREVHRPARGRVDADIGDAPVAPLAASGADLPQGNDNADANDDAAQRADEVAQYGAHDEESELHAGDDAASTTRERKRRRNRRSRRRRTKTRTDGDGDDTLSSESTASDGEDDTPVSGDETRTRRETRKHTRQDPRNDTRTDASGDASDDAGDDARDDAGEVDDATDDAADGNDEAGALGERGKRRGRRGRRGGQRRSRGKSRNRKSGEAGSGESGGGDTGGGDTNGGASGQADAGGDSRSRGGDDE